ncbi:hypothetical protein F183_A24340 [Bryobacterales bacterium F-183]|nr:hypothetical protein F183_A24340 [Bryobacterales bacterium F-183]
MHELGGHAIGSEVHLLGQSLLQLGRQLFLQKNYSEARESLSLSLEFQPDAAETWFEMGNVLHAAGSHAEAEERYAGAVALDKSYAEAWYNLGVVRLAQGHVTPARQAFERTVMLRPSHAEAHNNLAITMQATGQWEEAIAHYRQASYLSPSFAAPQYNLGMLLQECGEFEDAAATYATLVEQHPEHTDGCNNLANVFLELGMVRESRIAYDAVLARDPRHPEANWNRGLLQLQMGEWEAGWANYEWRLRQPRSNLDRFPLDMPRWDGQVRKGHRILLIAEQGLGDALQFLRYAAVVKNAVAGSGGSVIVECHKPLLAVAARAEGVDAVCAIGAPRPPYDCWVPLMSVPAAMRLGGPPAPANGGYLAADGALAAAWAEKLGALCGEKRRVGVVWSGNPSFTANAKRTLAPQDVRNLTAGHPDIAFVSLQKGVAMIDGAGLLDPAHNGETMEDLAAILANLDLVVTVDTSVAHLAGAMGCPTWVMLPHAADWRWMKNREDSPWYPSMRLFRQESRGNWAPVVEAVKSELALLVE